LALIIAGGVFLCFGLLGLIRAYRFLIQRKETVTFNFPDGARYAVNASGLSLRAALEAASPERLVEVSENEMSLEVDGKIVDASTMLTLLAKSPARADVVCAPILPDKVNVDVFLRASPYSAGWSGEMPSRAPRLHGAESPPSPRGTSPHSLRAAESPLRDLVRCSPTLMTREPQAAASPHERSPGLGIVDCAGYSPGRSPKRPQ
jgi:hypothetical protein